MKEVSAVAGLLVATFILLSRVQVTEPWATTTLLAVFMVVLVVGYRARILGRREANRAAFIGWSALIWCSLAFSLFLAGRLVDMGPSQYSYGTVVGFSRATRPPGSFVELDRASVEVPVATVQVHETTVDVYGQWFEIGERVCVRRTVGRWTKQLSLEVVDVNACSARHEASQ